MADRYKFQCGKYADGDLRVLSFRGTEGVSRLFRYEIELTSPGADIDLDSMVGQRARLLIGSIESRRYVNGIIERFEQGGSGGAADETIYCATLVPTVAPLGLITNCRVFQEVSTIEIVKQVFAQAKLPSEALRIGVRESSYKPRDYCVQYQETDLAFICRLLEEEGIAFFFEHSERKDVMAIVDAPAGWKGVPGADNLVYRHHHDSALAPEGVTVLNASSSMYAGKALLRDYRFVHPDLSDMEVTASGSAFSQYQRYFYPGEYVEPQLGDRLVRVRLQEQEWQRHVYHGSANVAALVSGHRFHLKEHPRAGNNQEYLILSFVVSGGHACGDTPASFALEQLRCIPAQVQFRPERKTPRPHMSGVHTAIVVGPEGEEISCDKFGRVRVRFHWDRRTERRGESSCWIRVSQPWAGNAYGGMFLPRIGQEVVVDFIDGDPDRPIIIGRVYNGDNALPYGLPGSKTVSTLRSNSSPRASGFNELRFEDEANNEEFYVHAQRNFKKEILKDSDTTINGNHTETIDGNSTYKIKKDWTIGVDGNRDTTIGGNETLTVKKNQSTTVEGDRSARIKGNDQLEVDKDQHISIRGNLDETVDKKLNQHVQGDISQSTDANLSIQASKNISITADGDVSITGRNITLTGNQKVTIVVGGNTITLSSSGITIDGSKVKINGAGGTAVN